MAEPPAPPLLVLGDDGTPSSDVAWEWLDAHPWPGWSIEACTAVEEPEGIEWGKPPEVREWIPPWPRALGGAAGAASVRFLSVATDPRAMLADRTDARLLVVGLRKTGTREALLSASTTEWLLHHPPAPLAIVRTADVARRVVACVDGSDHALGAVRAFAGLPLAAQCEISVLAVDDGRANTGAATESAMVALAEHGLGATSTTASGKPTQALLDVLEERRPDLVVMGTRGLTGWTRLRLGSTAAAVVRAAPCSSLVSCEPVTT